MHPQAAIDAARRCIASLERGSSVNTEDLATICEYAGEPCEMLWRRLSIGWFPTGDTTTVIMRLQDYIDERRRELP